MAEGSDPFEKGLKELGEEITCPICLQHFRDPKVLPCCHYYCSECIRQLAARVGPNQPFPCPQCSEDTLLPQNDPNQLHTVSFVSRLKDLYAKMEKAEGKVEVVCDSCSAGKAKAFCRQCKDFICRDCVRSHRKMKAFSGHEVVNLEELRKGGARRIPLKETPPMMCKEHDKQMKIFCFDCDRLICHDCATIDHTDHRYEFVKKTAPQCREELKNQLVPLQKIQDDLSAAITRIEAAKGDVLNHNAGISISIKQSFAKLHDALTRHEQDLLSKASNLVQQKLDALTLKEESFEFSSSEIQSLVEFVERNRRDTSDEELMMIHKHILSRVEEESEKRAKTCAKQLEETADTASVFVQTLDTVGIEDMLDEASVFSFQGPGMKTATVGEQTEFFMCYDYRSERQYQTARVIEAKLQSLVNDYVTSVTVTSEGKGSHRLAYCPMVRGRHSLTITVNGIPISDRPFPVFVKIHPSKLGNTVRVIKGLEKPRSIAFNSQQQLVVSKCGGMQATVVDKTGKGLHEIKAAEFKLPSGVAVDKDGNIYIGDRCSVFRFSRDRQLLKTYSKKGKKPGELEDVGSVRVINNKVYVCDRKNHRIQVFTRELKFIQSFGSKGSGKGQFIEPQDIVQDQRGNLYVTDRYNNRVQVFTNEWEFMHELGVGKLEEPTCTCFDTSDFLYVCSWANNKVLVFSITGELVSSFCKTGEKEGELKSPWGMAFDEDGFLYVCDLGNDRIQVF